MWSSGLYILPPLVVTSVVTTVVTTEVTTEVLLLFTSLVYFLSSNLSNTLVEGIIICVRCQEGSFDFFKEIIIFQLTSMNTAQAGAAEVVEFTSSVLPC